MAPLSNAEVDDPIETCRVHAADSLDVAADRPVGEAHRRHRRDAAERPHPVRDLRREPGEAVGLDHVVGPQARRGVLTHRRPRRRAERRGQPDQCQPDHERGRGDRRTTRVAHGVGAREHTGRAEPPQRRADRAYGRTRDRGQDHHDADQDGERAERNHLDLVEEPGDVARPGQPVHEDADADRENDQPRDDAAHEPADGPRRHVGDRGHGRHTRGPQRRDHRREHRDQHADDERHDDRARLDHDTGVGKVEPQTPEQLEQAGTERDTRDQTEERRHRADRERLEHHRPHDLATGRAHGAQQPELAGALSHEDGEGVEDDEGTDDDTDRGEPEERIGEEAEELPHRLADLQCGLVGGEHLVGRAERPGEAGLEYRVGNTGIALDVHRVDRRAGVELPLGGGEVERGKGHGAEVGRVTEAEQTDDPVLLRRAAEQDPHPVPHCEPVLARGAGVHRHLAGAGGWPASGQSQGTPVHPRDPERRGTTTADRVARSVDELGERRAHEPLGPPDAGDGSYVVDRRIRDAAGIRQVTERGGPLHLEIDPGEGLGEDRVEGPFDRVGEDVGGADEADAEEYGQRGQGKADLPGQEAPDRRLPHPGARSLLGPIMAERTGRGGAPLARSPGSPELRNLWTTSHWLKEVLVARR